MLYAMFALSMLTILLGFIGLKARIAAVKSGNLSIDYFALMQGEQVPDTITKSSRCFSNLFEVPVLFYVVGTLYIVLQGNNIFAEIIAWGFVIARCIQAYIHLTYNHVLHRMLAFSVSVLCVLLLWVNLLITTL